MKKNFYLILTAIIIFTSCQKDLTFDNSGVPKTGTGTGTGTGSNSDCKACSYLPMCNGAWYTYNDTLGGTASSTTDTLLVIKDTTIDSKTFAKIYSPVSKTNIYYNCTNGASRLIAYNSTTFGGSNITVADITILKANLPLGGTWKDQLTNPTGQQVTYADSIVEKSISRTVNGKTYNDVIHVYVETGIDVPVLGFLVVTITDYYFAKGVGQIEAIISDATSGVIFEHRALKSYFIP
jgi:hypothetical protein